MLQDSCCSCPRSIAYFIEVHGAFHSSNATGKTISNDSRAVYLPPYVQCESPLELLSHWFNVLPAKGFVSLYSSVLVNICLAVFIVKY